MLEFCTAWRRLGLLTLFLAIALAGCASMGERDTLLVVKKDKFLILDREAATTAELLNILIEHKVKYVAISSETDNAYEEIGKAIYTVNRSGAHVRTFNGKALDK